MYTNRRYRLLSSLKCLLSGSMVVFRSIRDAEEVNGVLGSGGVALEAGPSAGAQELGLPLQTARQYWNSRSGSTGGQAEVMMPEEPDRPAWAYTATPGQAPPPGTASWRWELSRILHFAGAAGCNLADRGSAHDGART